jgi:indolepyruvate ferredoxin oxidoreductase
MHKDQEKFMPLGRIIHHDSIYNQEAGPVFMTGIQALVRLPLMQRRLDRHQGLNTAGLISGYRGSPLGAYDQQLWKARRYLEAHDVVFQPGLNEDLAATALWGAQMHKAYGPTRADGVFGIWYGKGNGVDRTGDVFRNANVLGTSPLGGVLAIGGDDHAAQSSMFPHQTDGIFQSVMMPVLQPASVSEILSLGLAGIALSRFCGLWVAMKTIAEVVESAASFTLPDAYPAFQTPVDNLPAHGLNWDPGVAWPDQRTELERRMIEERLPAAIAWAKINQLDRPVLSGGAKGLCIVTVGKAHQDVMQALDDLDIDADGAARIGLSVYKVAMSWPLDCESLLAFADGFDEIFVVEEKRPAVEEQIKMALYNRPVDRRPIVTGKRDAEGHSLLPETLEFSARQMATVLAARLAQAPDLVEKARLLERRGGGEVIAFPARKPFFCSGCPHNSSTVTPDGSISGGGIGCHVMALSQPRLKTSSFSQMGGEGMQWVGAAPFSSTEHIFQNLGDGTYQHSGLLAIRAAVAAQSNITYKILYNDAVAMTGGQPAEGAIDPARITRQLAAEGVGTIHLVTDEPDRWHGDSALAPGVQVDHRDRLNTLQRHLRTVPGVTAIVYVQTCAAEKRRRRKRGDFPDPDRRLFINPRVCEGCGDCSVQANCIAVEPLETDFGRKRRINQSSCNKDFSCVKGFCPSFVEVEAAQLRKPDTDRLRAIEAERFPQMVDPTIADINASFNIYIAGIGGLGVLTIGALLGSAAHLDGLEASVLDFTGLAQKNGAVVSQVRIARHGRPIHAVRISRGEVDLMLGTDAVVAAAPDGLTKLQAGRSAVVLNTDETPTSDSVTDRNASVPSDAMHAALMRRVKDNGFLLKATSLAEGLFGISIAANIMLVGYAWQKGLLPLSTGAIKDAINANGAAVALNHRAFDWGRLAAIDMPYVERVAGVVEDMPVQRDVRASIDFRADELVLYQDEHYARRYRQLLAMVVEASAGLGEVGEAFTAKVAANAYRLMAYKDEYEVARLYTSADFRAALDAQFGSTQKISIYLAPPFLSRIDPATGRRLKRRFGRWVFPVLAWLAKGKRLRGTWADPFGGTQERRMERRLASDYIALVEWLCAGLNEATLPLATALVSVPDEIRGFGPVKEEAMTIAHRRTEDLLRQLDAMSTQPDRTAA